MGEHTAYVQQMTEGGTGLFYSIVFYLGQGIVWLMVFLGVYYGIRICAWVLRRILGGA